MRHLVLTVFIIASSLISAPMAAGDNVLPPLPTEGYISGRISTQQDVTDGNAAFATPPDQDSRRNPIHIKIPQYGVYLGDGKNNLVFIIQAEEIDGASMIGARYPDGGEVVGTTDDFHLLGVEPKLSP